MTSRFLRFRGPLAVRFFVVLSLVLSVVSTRSWAAEENAAAAEAEGRLSNSLKYLASDELEGRGVGTKGLDKAADFIAKEFAQLGLQTKIIEGSPYQKFTMTTGAKLGPKEKNTIAILAPAEKKGGKPQRIELKLGTDYTPLAIGGSSKVDLPLVFVGYGISAKDEKYDEYTGIDVKGKAVLLLRKEPQQGNPHSVFSGTKPSQHAFFTRKISNAYEHGAAAVIIVNDDYSLQQQSKNQLKTWDQTVAKLAETRLEFQKLAKPMAADADKYRAEINKLAERIGTLGKNLNGNFDKVLTFTGAGRSSSHRKMPVLFANRVVFEPAIQAIFDTDLVSLEKQIDKELKPQSRELTGFRIVGQTEVEHTQAEVKNVIGVLEGEGPLADETVVVGAHYDHLGRGGAGSLAPWTKDIHNGADDNASGASALLEVARQIATSGKKPSRRIVFIAFTAEERGLLGSAHYVRNPRFALENTVAMVNMDMVGRLTDNKLIVHGTGTATKFDGMVDELNKKYAFKMTKKPGGFGPSDHASFYAKKIPVLHVFTGTHKDYHRPSDDFDKINVAGMRRITEMVSEIVVSIVEDKKRPEYKETKRQRLARGGSRPYFGSIPDFSQTVEGYALMGVTKDGPAQKAGLKAGDVVVKFGPSKIGGLGDFDSALRKYKAGSKVPVVVKRDGKLVTVTVTLGAPR